MALLSKLSWIGMGKENTEGTAVAPTIFIPVTGAQPEDLPNFIPDTSIANAAYDVRGVYEGERDSAFDFDGMLYFEHIGSFLVALGFADTVTGSSSPYTHTFKIPTAGTQPPSWTMHDYNVVESRRTPGCRMDQFDLTIDAKGAIKYAAKMKGWGSASSASSAPTFPSTAAALGYETSVTLNSASSARVLSAGLTIKREAEGIHVAQNSQDPSTVFAGPASAELKIKALFNDNTDLNFMLNNTQPPMVFTITQPGGGSNPVWTITASKVAVTKAASDRSSKYMQINISSTLVGQSTDQGPLAFTLSNSASSAY